MYKVVTVFNWSFSPATTCEHSGLYTLSDAVELIKNLGSGSGSVQHTYILIREN